MNKEYTRQQIQSYIWDTCSRIGAYEYNTVHELRYGKTKDPYRLPEKLLKFISTNFRDLAEVNNFFASTNKPKNAKIFLDMLEVISPFQVKDMLFEGSMFVVKTKRIIPVMTTTYQG